MGSAGYIGKSVSLCTVFEYLGGHGTSLELMAYTHWPQPRPEEGPGTNGLYKTVPKLLHCTWHWTGAQTYCSPLFCLQSPFLSRSQFHSVWIHHYSSDNCDKVKHRLKNVAYILNECSRIVEESTCCEHAYIIFWKFQGVTQNVTHRHFIVDAQMLTYGTKASRDSKSGAYLFMPDGQAKVYTVQHDTQSAWQHYLKFFGMLWLVSLSD